MKRIVFTLLITLFVGTAMAQDVLITKDGDPIKVWGVEISNNAVFYRESEDENAPIKRMNKADLLMIKYQNGEKILIDSEQPQGANQQATAGTPATEFVEDKAANEAAIQRFNEENDVNYIGKIDPKPAPMLYGILKAKPTSVILDQNVELIVLPSRPYDESNLYRRNSSPYGCSLIAKIHNKSNRTIFMDLGTSFFIRGSQAVPFYIPQATTATSSQSSGVGVNMGAVAQAMGVGGTLGTMANGVTVGGGSTNGTSTVIYAQRVIAIPPFSTYELETQFLFPDNTEQIFGSNFKANPRRRESWGNMMEWTIPADEQWTIGEERELPAENNPLCFAYHITYSFSEDISNPHNLVLQLYTGKIIGVKRESAWSSNIGVVDYDAFPKEFSDVVSFMCLQK